ncbi:MAG: hypothetical protein COV74_03300 [Candidatus Omnitrophica bacterium CG11_big_fil_rev_8_21_14_0_20_45_26]|uniref:Uncharacterized protein n=1 Tax=Candidatus Abzuiibacterium crystallinum TaxID=1974748 RepID=A0A2H0LR88_9BACT|nr:MAG: hypothetical protein COV74_03300 [Candidatus Omnitrophica bacterium CG11_big_fil_rev_8_21_14_0_20_45_26]PIW64701.1 MAG: hypothetical protein COW12_05325 [Candidatus Omnitrophica bacterium CG12_big_fil_rev_8_21_14_0_65_45_16]
MNINDFYNKLQKKEKILIIAAIICVLMLLMDLLVLGPILAEQKVLDAEIDAKSQAIKRSIRVLSYKDSILREYRQYQHYLDSGEKAQEEIIADLLREIESIAAAMSINITNVQPGDVEGNPIMQEYKTTLECNGKLRNMLEFMQALEDSDFLFRITQYLLEPKGKNSDVINASLSMSRIFITNDGETEDEIGVEVMPAEVPMTTGGQNKTVPIPSEEET